MTKSVHKVMHKQRDRMYTESNGPMHVVQRDENGQLNLIVAVYIDNVLISGKEQEI